MSPGSLDQVEAYGTHWELREEGHKNLSWAIGPASLYKSSNENGPASEDVMGGDMAG